MTTGKQLPKRSEVRIEDTWDLTSMFADTAAWEKECEALEKQVASIEKYKSHMADSSGHMLAALQEADALLQRLETVYCYAMQTFDTDTTNPESQKLLGRARVLDVRFRSAASYMEPEILDIPEETLKTYLEEESGLQNYTQYLDNIRRQRAHTLSAEKEELLSRVEELSQGPGEIFSMFNNADLKFGSIENEEGETVEITHGRYIALLESTDRRVREEAFRKLYASYRNFENTLAATYQANLKATSFYAKVRNYPSSQAASLDDSNIPLAVYDNLLDTIHQNLPLMHRYVRLRKKLLGLEELHMYDLHVPIMDDMDRKIPFEQAKQMVREGLKPMGEEYLSILEEGFQNRWIDIYENQGKRSGAYSNSSYGNHPYVLLNYTENLKNVFTLAHEMGHSIHSYYSNSNQTFRNADYRLFVAEVASTCNESLLIHHLLAECTDKKERAYLLNYFLEQFKGTIFRQTMFAEFEKIAHEMVEAGETLNAEVLKKVYHQLNEEYFGGDVVIDEDIDMEWARIPHFYRDFYVYQYATGFSAAIALSRRILEKGEEAVADYKKFLKGGCSMYPIDLLKMAGVDMTTKEPVEAAMQTFGELLAEFEALMEA